MSGKVYIERIDGGVRFAETDSKGRLVRYLSLPDDGPVGNICRGKIERVTGAGAFVDIGREKHGFLPDTDKKAGDYVTVTVARAECGEKGCLLTEKLSVSGKYAVVSNGTEVRFSRKSSLSEEEKKRLRNRAGEGVVFRTALDAESEEEAFAEIAEMRDTLLGIEDKANGLFEVKTLLKSDSLRTAQNMTAKEICSDFSEIEAQIAEIGARKVVNNGVELVFDKTEAMTVIDVNSHLNTSKYADEDSYAYATDLIAAEEVCRQIRLRNIGGIIAVDFVSVRDADKIAKLKSKLNAALREDDVMAKAEFSEKFCIALISRVKRYSEA